MAVETFSPVVVSDDAWTLIADGATHAFVGLQVGDGVFGLAVAIAAVAPEADSDAYIVLQRTDEKSLSVDLDADSRIYARSFRGAAVVRGYRKAV